jgi:hypothetical protein
VWRLLLPPIELARQDSVLKRRRTEVTGVTGRVQSVAAAVEREGQLGFLTGASGRSWDRHVRSSPREAV